VLSSESPDAPTPSPRFSHKSHKNGRKNEKSQGKFRVSSFEFREPPPPPSPGCPKSPKKKAEKRRNPKGGPQTCPRFQNRSGWDTRRINAEETRWAADERCKTLIEIGSLGRMGVSEERRGERMRAELRGAVRLYNYGQGRGQAGQGLKSLRGEPLVRGIAFSKSRKVAIRTLALPVVLASAALGF
jgi:hypothetical protein